jgi:hypothetical protein
MTETGKTLTFVAVALVALGAAWLGRPRPVGVELPEQIGQILFPDFVDPYDAKSMEVVQFDEDLGQLETFRVALKQGMWVIPSHQDYPADAEENLKQAATLLVDLRVIDVVSDAKKDHVTFGVVKPDPEKTQLGDEGVGKLVTLKDEKGNRLAELVIGKEVAGQPEQRYVRAGDLDRVYVVHIDPHKMPTEFEKWVEQDVLQLNGFDIKQIVIRDYSVNPELTPRGITLNDEPRLDMSVSWNAEDFKWELDRLAEFRGGRMQPTTLLENEELDKDALDAMKTALDELKIIDVERKPTGLGAELKADQNFWNDQDAIQSLFDRGFYPAQMPNGELKLRSSDGEVVVRTKVGVDYTLRFGQVAGVERESDESKLSRFVMVTAALDENAFEKPILNLPEGMQKPETDDSSPSEDEQTKDSKSPSDAPATAEEKSAAPETEPKTAAESDGSEEPSDGDQAQAEGKADEDEDATSTVKTAKPPEGEVPKDPQEAERDRLLKEYDRKMEEYNDKVKKARDKVQELNYRFADWYYVISEDEYKKIHLGRTDVISEVKTSAEEGFGIDAFRKLEEEGLKQKGEATEQSDSVDLSTSPGGGS